MCRARISLGIRVRTSGAGGFEACCCASGSRDQDKLMMNADAVNRTAANGAVRNGAACKQLARRKRLRKTCPMEDIFIGSRGGNQELFCEMLTAHMGIGIKIPHPH